MAVDILKDFTAQVTAFGRVTMMRRFWLCAAGGLLGPIEILTGVYALPRYLWASIEVLPTLPKIMPQIVKFVKHQCSMHLRMKVNADT